MTKPAPNVVGDHSFYKSSKESYLRKAKGMSFFAFLLFTFVYISVFYIFNLSPSTLFNTTKFWFFITNTLILIIAADYGAYSSSKEEQGLHDEYMNMANKVKTSVPSLVSHEYPEVVYKETSNRPKIREVVVWHEKKIITQESDSFPESNIPHEVHVTTTDRSEKHHVHHHHDEDWQEKRLEVLPPKADHKIHSRQTVGRVKSEKARRGVIDESNNDIRRIGTETAKREPNLEENDQFSTMSVEELNRRVEEFIQRVNRQIRSN